MIGDLLSDVRFALRTLARRPGFTLTAMASLALGIGANTAVFSVVNGIMLRPLPYERPGELVAVWPTRFVSLREVQLFGDRMSALTGVAGAVPSWNAALTGVGDPAQLRGSRTTGNLFELLGVRATLGRTIQPEDALPGAEPVALLSHALWSTRFGGDRSIVGRRITLDGTPHTVIGVMPADFELLGRGTQIWQPLVTDRDEWYYKGGALFAIGRLAEGKSLEQASQDLKRQSAILKKELGLPDEYGRDASVVSLRTQLVGEVRTMLLVLLGAVGFLLLIAGSNLGNLLLTRALGRRNEMAIRRSLGAGRPRLIRQMLAESATLAAGGGLAGLMLAVWGVRLIRGMLPADTPRVAGIALDLHVLAVCGVLTVGSGLLFGLAPALVSVRSDLGSVLRGEGRIASPGGRGAQARRALVVVEVALGLTLAVGAGLMLRTLWNLSAVDPGFDPRNALTMKIQPAGSAFRGGEGQAHFYHELFNRLDAVPGVVAVGAIQNLPLDGGNWGTPVDIEGRDVPTGGERPVVGWRVIGADYLRAMSIPLLRGRPFTESDNPDAPPVVLVNQSLAGRFWPGIDPLGKRLRARTATGDEWAVIVGVVADVHHVGLNSDPVPELYRPLTQYPHGGMTLVVRTRPRPLTLLRTVEETVWSVDPDAPVSDVRTLQQVVYRSVARPRLILMMLGGFAVTGLLLAAIGIYGVIALSVAQRRREIGIRMALGAEPGRLMREVVGAGLRLAAVGALIGVGAALVLTRVMASLVFDVSVTDPVTIIAIALAVLATAASASLAPARQAVRVDPLIALREE